jgi:hypothetical protein
MFYLVDTNLVEKVPSPGDEALRTNVLASVSMQVPASGFLHAAHLDNKAGRNGYYRIPETVVDVARRNHQTERHGR